MREKQVEGVGAVDTLLLADILRAVVVAALQGVLAVHLEAAEGVEGCQAALEASVASSSNGSPHKEKQK